MPVIARTAVAFALCLAVGAHWAALQSLAWGTMIVKYSEHGSFANALAQTFDGNHPCDLCKRITNAQHPEKKPEMKSARAKLDMIAVQSSRALTSPYTEFSFPTFATNASALFDRPPIPPPRSELI